MLRPLAVLVGTFLISGLIAAPALQAQSYPTRPVRVVVPTGPGGGYDFIGRLLAEKLTEELAQQVIVENRAGAGGQIGTLAVATAPADGYTLLVGGPGNMAWNPALSKTLPYNVIADFTPISLVASFSFTLIARTDLPLATLLDVVGYARANPGKLTIANVGTGTGQHMSAALFKYLANVDFLHVGYKSAQAVYPDLLSGRVDLFFENTSIARPHIEGGRVKAIATTAGERNPQLPQVPTAQEAGVPGLVLESWIGLFAPSKTPKPVIERLRAGIAKAMQSPDMRNRLQTGGWRILSMPSPETEAFVKAEAEKWPPILRQAGIAAE